MSIIMSTNTIDGQKPVALEASVKSGQSFFPKAAKDWIDRHSNIIKVGGILGQFWNPDILLNLTKLQLWEA